MLRPFMIDEVIVYFYKKILLLGNIFSQIHEKNNGYKYSFKRNVLIICNNVPVSRHKKKGGFAPTFIYTV